MNDWWFFLKSDAGKVSLTIFGFVLTASLGTTFFLLNRKRKALTYEILSMTRVLTMKEEVAGRIKILFDETPVSDVGIVRIRLTNTGTEAIRESEFVRPISFSVSKDAYIIEADITHKAPNAFDVGIRSDKRCLTIEPALMNAKDSVSIKLMIANFDGKIRPDARIEGTNLKPRRRYIWALKKSLTETVVMIGFAVALASISKSKHAQSITIVILGIIAASIITILSNKLFKSGPNFPNDYGAVGKEKDDGWYIP
jgi:hypothetical protein